MFLKEGFVRGLGQQRKDADFEVETTKTDPGKPTSLADYVERMPGDQTTIYYLAGETRALMTQSPHLESYLAQGREVLLPDRPGRRVRGRPFRQYKGKSFQAIDKIETADAIDDETKAKYQPLLDLLKSKIPESRDARLTKRLKESAVCLMNDEGAYSANMQRMMQRMGRGDMPRREPSPRILEVNAEHPVIQSLDTLRAKERRRSATRGSRANCCTTKPSSAKAGNCKIHRPSRNGSTRC